MTEIHFLLDLILNHKMSKEAKQKCIDRVGELDNLMQQTPVKKPLERSLEERAIAVQTNPVNVPVPIVMASKRIIGGEVDTGNGTKGPRKF